MVARNVPFQEISFSRQLEVSEEDREFLTLKELKPHLLTELGPSNVCCNTMQTLTNTMNPVQDAIYSDALLQPHQDQEYIYYDLNLLSTTSGDGKSCAMYMRSSPNSTSRKRDKLDTIAVSDIEDEAGGDKAVLVSEDSKKQNHSEIEKRRRDKMNTYITELSAILPMRPVMSRKLDKLTVLRMAVQHMKALRGSISSYTEGHYKTTFLSDHELKMLTLQAVEGFLFVVGCDRGRILYVSESVSKTLNYTQGQLLGQNMFDILHPADVDTVKEQLLPSEKLFGSKIKSDLHQSLYRFCPGGRRSFFCRMKCKAQIKPKQSSDATSSSHRRKKQVSPDKKYIVTECTGYLKSWAPAKNPMKEQDIGNDEESCNLSCLVAIGRVPKTLQIPNASASSSERTKLRPIHFLSRHTMDGKYVFVDHGAIAVLGFLPQELLNTSMYAYCHRDDISTLTESLKLILRTGQKLTTSIYRFRTKEKGFLLLQSEWKLLLNPWTKELQYIYAKNLVILNDTIAESTKSPTDVSGSSAIISSNSGNVHFFDPSNCPDLDGMINYYIEATNIDGKVARQVLDANQRAAKSSSESSPDYDQSNAINQLPSRDEASAPDNDQWNVRQKLPEKLYSVPNQSASNDQYMTSAKGQSPEVIEMIATSASESYGQTDNKMENDEVATSIIMSLLEADAGLGGSVDFADIPWPLP